MVKQEIIIDFVQNQPYITFTPAFYWGFVKWMEEQGFSLNDTAYGLITLWQTRVHNNVEHRMYKPIDELHEFLCENIRQITFKRYKEIIEKTFEFWGWRLREGRYIEARKDIHVIRDKKFYKYLLPEGWKLKRVRVTVDAFNKIIYQQKVAPKVRVRRFLLLSFLSLDIKHKPISINVIAKDFNVHPQTIIKDIRYLEDNDLIESVQAYIEVENPTQDMLLIKGEDGKLRRPIGKRYYSLVAIPLPLGSREWEALTGIKYFADILLKRHKHKKPRLYKRRREKGATKESYQAIDYPTTNEELSDYKGFATLPIETRYLFKSPYPEFKPKTTAFGKIKSALESIKIGQEALAKRRFIEFFLQYTFHIHTPAIADINNDIMIFLLEFPMTCPSGKHYLITDKEYRSNPTYQKRLDNLFNRCKAYIESIPSLQPSRINQKVYKSFKHFFRTQLICRLNIIKQK